MESKVILALDFSSADQAEKLVKSLAPQWCALKVGKELFTAAGPGYVSGLVARGFRVFLDLKFHDIPNTVAGAVSEARKLGVWMLTLHIAGGRAMLTRAREALAAEAKHERTLLIGVTLLTSLRTEDLQEIGIGRSAQDQVLAMAAIADECGLDGLVCSPLELSALRQRYGDRFQLITPGIRPLGSDSNDQARIATPERALQEGADYLVIGRAITEASDPVQRLHEVNQSLASVT